MEESAKVVLHAVPRIAEQRSSAPALPHVLRGILPRPRLRGPNDARNHRKTRDVDCRHSETITMKARRSLMFSYLFHDRVTDSRHKTQLRIGWPIRKIAQRDASSRTRSRTEFEGFGLWRSKGMSNAQSEEGTSATVGLPLQTSWWHRSKRLEVTWEEAAFMGVLLTLCSVMSFSHTAKFSRDWKIVTWP